MFGGWRNPICTLPFAEPVAHTLDLEFAEQPLAWRLRRLRKVAFRELALRANGQARRRVAQVPQHVSSLLWVYTATVIGAAIMDLAARALVPRRVEIDLLIAPALAPLFSADRRIRQVHSNPNILPDDIDFLLLDSFRSTSLGLKKKRYPQLPFASMRGHNAGDGFDRTAFADCRIRQLFGLPDGEVVTPTLDFGERGATVFDDQRFRVALALGSRAARKAYPHWKEVLRNIVAQWPAGLAAPEFRLFGAGGTARRDRAAIGKEFVAVHCSDELDLSDLRESMIDVAECDAFLGVEGTLMHIAVGVGTPGLALFAGVDPAYSLRPGGTMQALCGDSEVSDLAAVEVAAAFIAALPRFAQVARVEAIA
jgi:Glycosyltransferase family 9 (heptosyltransferase)